MPLLEDHITKGVGKILAKKVVNNNGELEMIVSPDNLVNLLRYLRDDQKCLFSILVALCGVDYPGQEKRFQVVYNLLSLKLNQRIRVIVEVSEEESVPSVVELFSSACWYERETFDMYGIKFSGAKDIRRLLTDYGFEGHPLRKDFPLSGFEEVRYDLEQKKVIKEPVSLDQEYRDFDFLSPWEGSNDYQVVTKLPGDEKAVEENK